LLFSTNEWKTMMTEKDVASENQFLNSDFLIVEPGGRLVGEPGHGSIPPIPGDKSLSHRVALLAAMADGQSAIRNFQVSGVTQAMLRALSVLEVLWSLDGTTLQVDGIGLGSRNNQPTLYFDCGNSATTLRLLAGALAAWGQPAVLDGSPGLRRRPMNRIISPLQEMGLIIGGSDGCAPLTLSGTQRPLKSISHTLSVASAQVKSCLLLAALSGEGATHLEEPGPSRDHTERLLRSMGVDVKGEIKQKNGISEVYCTTLQPPNPLALPPLDLTLPGDMSAAAFLIVAALTTPGSKVNLRGVGLNPTRTGLLDALLDMGGQIEVHNRRVQGGEPMGDLHITSSHLHGVRVKGERVVRMIDEFPAFSVAAACASGQTVVEDAEELRYKESDRISALGVELCRLGISFKETADGFVVQGGKPVAGGVVESHGDHRLAMSLALVGLFATGTVQVNGSRIIRESFPDFASILKQLGANIQ